MLAFEEYCKPDRFDFGQFVYIDRRLGSVWYRLTLEDIARSRFALTYSATVLRNERLLAEEKIRKATEGIKDKRQINAIKTREMKQVKEKQTQLINETMKMLPEQWQSVRFFIDSLIHFHPETYDIPTYLPHLKFGVFVGEKVMPKIWWKDSEDRRHFDREAKERNYNVPDGQKKEIEITAPLVSTIITRLLKNYRRAFIFDSRAEEFVFIKTVNYRLERTHLKKKGEDGRDMVDENNRFIYEEEPMDVLGVEPFSYTSYQEAMENIKRRKIRNKQDEINRDEEIEILNDYMTEDWYKAMNRWRSFEFEKYLKNVEEKKKEGWEMLSLEEKIQEYWRLSNTKTRKELLEESGITVEKIPDEAPKFLRINPKRLSEVPHGYIRMEYDKKMGCKVVYYAKTLYYYIQDLITDEFTYRTTAAQTVDNTRRIETLKHPFGHIGSIKENKNKLEITFDTTDELTFKIELTEDNIAYEDFMYYKRHGRYPEVYIEE